MSDHPLVPASKLEGEKVINSQHEELGIIKDIMVDPENGSIAYYVLSFGGFMGMGDKLFAIPPETICVDRDKGLFVLDMDKDFLADAPGFDKDNWPNMATPEFKKSVYSFYGYDITGLGTVA